MVTRKGSRPASAEQRLNELGIKLPAPPEPFGAYVEAVLTGNLLFLSGMLPVLTRTRELALARKVLFTLKARRELAGLQFGLDEQDAWLTALCRSLPKRVRKEWGMAQRQTVGDELAGESEYQIEHEREDRGVVDEGQDGMQQHSSADLRAGHGRVRDLKAHADREG